MSPDDRTLIEQQQRANAGESLTQIVATMLRELRPGAPVRPIHLDDTIEHQLGLDSLSRVELVARIERAFGVRLPDHLAITARTLRDLLDAVMQAGPAAAPSPIQAPTPESVVGTPETAQTILDAFRWHLERHPDREHITLVEGDEIVEILSYARLWAHSSDVACGLAAAGVGRGDTVAIMLPTCSGFFDVFLGAMCIGALPVPMYPPLRWSEIEDHVRGRAAILENARARMLVTVPEAVFIGRLMRARLPHLSTVISIDDLRNSGGKSDVARFSGHDTALLQYTSGSTGDPKGVILSHDNLLANIRAMGNAAAVISSDRFVSWLPLYHDMGLIGAWLATMYHAVPLVLMPPTSFLARPSRWLWAIHRYRATLSAAPNFAYEIVASKVRDEDLIGLDLRSWRLAINGAEPVRAATLERFADRFTRYGFDRGALTPVYGLAESALGLAFPPLGRGPLVEHIDALALANDGRAIQPGDSAAPKLDVVSCGRPLPGHDIRIVDEAEHEMPDRTEGRVEFHGPSATAGYHQNAEATKPLFHGEWLDTGDVGYIAAGELFLTSRAKDLIKRGGHSIHPYDPEAAIGDLPRIRKGCVAVFGTMDHASGTERVIVVAESHESDPASRTALRDRIMTVAAIHLGGPADETLLVPPRTILKTSSGKIRRAACRELYEKGLLEAPRHAVWLQLTSLICRAAAARLRRGGYALVNVAYGVYCWLVFLLVSAGGVVLLSLLSQPQARYRLAHRLAKKMFGAAGIQLTVEGLAHLPAGKPIVLIVNHASYIDAMALIATLPFHVHFATKREFARMPVFGFVLRRLGTYFVERDAAKGEGDDTRELTAAVDRGETVVLFPEGTFSRAPGLAAFHLGAFVISARTEAPVVPIVLRGTRSVLRDKRWLPSRYPIVVNVQPPIKAAGRDWSAAVRLRDQARAIMLRQCDEPDLAP